MVFACQSAREITHFSARRRLSKIPLARAGRAAVRFLLPKESSGVMVVLRGLVEVAYFAEENLMFPRLPVNVVEPTFTPKGPGEEPLRWVLGFVDCRVTHSGSKWDQTFYQPRIPVLSLDTYSPFPSCDRCQLLGLAVVERGRRVELVITNIHTLVRRISIHKLKSTSTRTPQRLDKKQSRTQQHNSLLFDGRGHFYVIVLALWLVLCVLACQLSILCRRNTITATPLLLLPCSSAASVMARYLSPHCLREMVQLRRNRTSVFFIFILWVARLQYASSAIILHSFSPLTAPRSGGSLLSVTGQDFISGVSQCQFLHSSYGSTSSTNNIVYNSTFMVCTVPLIGFVPQSVLSPTVNVQVRIASPPQLSNSIDLTLFDLTQMSVASINPVEGFNTSATSVSIYGSGFVNTHESTCVTNSLTMTAEYVGPTALRCQMPLYPIPSQVVLDVLLNGQTSSRLARPLNSTIFTYFSTPPNIGVCEFASSYTLLLLEFDREIEVGNEMGPALITPLNCGLVFDNKSNSILGDGAECSWLNTQQRQVVVQLTADSTIQLGTLLTINSNTLRTRHVAFSKLASGSIAVQQSPLQPLLPVAIITGPEQIPNCGNLTLSGAQSRNGGPKPLFFMWNITLVMDALTGSGLGSGMNYLNPLKMNIMLEESTDSVSIPAEYFQGDQQYLVILTVRNFLGHQDSSETVLKKSAVLAPNVWVVGKRELSVSVDTEVLIEGVSSLPPCVDKGAGVLYHWAIHSKEPIPFLSYLENPIMAIPAHTLRHSSVYSTTLTVTVNSHTANTTVLIHTQREPIVTRIAGGITITHVQQQTLLIDGTASRGLDQTVTNDSSFTAEWSCTQVAVNVSCSSLGVLRMNELQLEIQPNSLLIGEHIFTLTITYNSTSSTASQTVIVIAHSAPTVTISVLTRPNLVPVHRKLILHGTVSSSHPARAEWSIVYKPGELTCECESTPPVNVDTFIHISCLLPINMRLFSNTEIH